MKLLAFFDRFTIIWSKLLRSGIWLQRLVQRVRVSEWYWQISGIFTNLRHLATYSRGNSWGKLSSVYSPSSCRGFWQIAGKSVNLHFSPFYSQISTSYNESKEEMSLDEVRAKFFELCNKKIPVPFAAEAWNHWRRQREEV